MDRHLAAERVEYQGRKAVRLMNGKVRALIDQAGGMMPEFGLERGKATANVHWIPGFRGNSGRPWDPKTQADYWKVKLLHQIAGDFPCSPNFGPPCSVDGTELPPHGWAANEEWRLEEARVDGESEAAIARFSLASPAATMPLSWTKTDIMLGGQAAYYSVMTIANSGPTAVSVNLARHNTLGAPFLQAGCRIALSAERFLAAPTLTEFDDTGRLRPGLEFGSLREAPLRSGGKADISLVPGMIGYTDFVTGPVPADAELGWSCVVNPELGQAYICFFPGPLAAGARDIALGFNDLWMQYGGRNFTPWALHDGGSDLSFCLGTENATGAYANGLTFSRANPELLGRPTMVEVPAGGERRLLYGVAIVELDKGFAGEAIESIEAEDACLVIKGKVRYQKAELDARFRRVKRL